MKISLLPSGARQGVGRVLFQRGSRILILLALIFAAGMVAPYFHRSSAQTFATSSFYQVGANNSIDAFTVTPSAAGGVQIYSVAAYCGSNPTVPVQLNIHDSIGFLWQGDANGSISAIISSFYWPTPLTARPASPTTIQIGACGVGIPGTIMGQYAVR